VSGPVDFQDYVEGFLAEADEHLGSASAQLIELDRAAQGGQPHPRAVRELFRSLHTIKGLASMVGIEPIVDVAHEMETLLRDADRAGGRVPAAAVDLLVQGARAIEERVTQLARKQPVAPAPARLVAALSAVTMSAPASAAASAEAPRLSLPADVEAKLSASEREQIAQGVRGGRRAMAVEFVPAPEKAARGLNITAARERLSALGELVKVVPRSLPGTPGGLAFSLILITSATDQALADALEIAPEVRSQAVTEAVARAGAASGEASDAGAAAGSRAERAAGLDTPDALDDDGPGVDDGPVQAQTYVRVDIARLDDALEKLSALVVTRFRLGRAVAELAARGADTRALDPIVGEITRQLRDLRAAIMQARMMSLAEMLQRVPLLVRGLTRNTEKIVALSIQVGDAELDKSVADQLFPALVHLVRNAVDHAIEPRQERRRLGKPEAGHIAIACNSQSGTHLTLTISDDGRGIDREDVARKARQPVPRTDEQLLELIAMPGFSTRDEASRLSGRGMGVDIVKRTVDALGGALSLQTRPGQGTSFTLRVPLSVTIVDTFSFTAGAQTFVAPVSMVEEIIEIDASRVARPPASERAAATMIERRGRAMPLVSLASVLRVPGSAPPGAGKALVVKLAGRHRDEPVAYGIERMLGQQEVVIRPLQDPLVRRVGITGATDLGDGKPTLVLDLVALGATLFSRARAES
jgi:two-component system chemotaxis sensor kinase CheA